MSGYAEAEMEHLGLKKTVFKDLLDAGCNMWYNYFVGKGLGSVKSTLMAGMSVCHNMLNVFDSPGWAICRLF